MELYLEICSKYYELTSWNVINSFLQCMLHCPRFLLTIPLKCTLLEMCLVCLVSLPLLDIQIADWLSNIIWGASSGTISESLFNTSWINILKCDEDISAVHATLYSLYALDWESGPGTCVTWSIDPPW